MLGWKCPERISVDNKIEKLNKVKDFESLIEYLREELDWPIEEEQTEDLVFNYTAKELGIADKYAAKVEKIKQFRPLTDNQPWGIFYVEFEVKKLPVVVLRKVLKSLIKSRRMTDDKLPTWELSELIFISSIGEIEERKISFAHFTEQSEGISELRTFSWDKYDTQLHYKQSTIDLEKLRWPDDETDKELWKNNWSSAFGRKHRIVIKTTSVLCKEMARIAKHIREQIKEIYKYESQYGRIHKLLNSFRNTLIERLDINAFADMYAQTITYGLFSARAANKDAFQKEQYSEIIPKTNPFLKNLFRECFDIRSSSSLDLDELTISDLIEILRESDIETILADFGRMKKGEDPVIHFYEEFLKEYDKEQKVERGVFYTPDAVVSFIVKSVDEILKLSFDCVNGLADNYIGYSISNTEDLINAKKMNILDPAVGTGTFLKHVITIIKNNFDIQYRNLSKTDLRTKWNDYVNENLLSRIFGFELMLAPYAVAHLKLGLELSETGYDFKGNKRLGLFVTNSLEKSDQTLESFYNWLAEEANLSNKIKTKKPIHVIIGNPPYSGESQNKNKWIDNLLKKRYKNRDGSFSSSYYELDGQPLKERNLKWLQDDYVKFIRFAQMKIDQAGIGIFSYITNHSYLDNPTFRGMRKSLLDSFDEIYILNLHGSALKQKKSPDCSKDENVFAIRQGVSIVIFVKSDKIKNKKVFYYDLYGTRKQKFHSLDSFSTRGAVKAVPWTEIQPQDPYYFFIPFDDDKMKEYKTFVKITDIFPIKSVGIITARDHFTIKYTEGEIWEQINDFVKMDEEEARRIYSLGNDVRDWKVSFAKRDLIESKLNSKNIKKILYRPFDFRFTYYTGVSRGFHCMPRPEVMSQMLSNNIAILTTRLQDKPGFFHALVTDTIVEGHQFKEITYAFPLYLHDISEKKMKMKKIHVRNSIKYNLDSEFIQELWKKMKIKISEEELFSYIYAILFSNKYRTRFSNHLKIDFPRIPFTEDYKLFSEISKLGQSLIELHVMELKLQPSIQYNIEGNNEVEKIVFKEERVYINSNQFFEGISKDFWEYKIGSYMVLQQWLKYRKGKILDMKEIEMFIQIVGIIERTIKIQTLIDELVSFE